MTACGGDAQQKPITLVLLSALRCGHFTKMLRGDALGGCIVTKELTTRSMIALAI